MTEDEAKTKLCIGPSPHNTGVPGDRQPNGMIYCYCSGSACMAWRWSLGWPLPNDPPDIRDRYHGYCGLAGEP